jgi:dolichyl-phosphate beta-glucosyltransferase
MVVLPDLKPFAHGVPIIRALSGSVALLMQVSLTLPMYLSVLIPAFNEQKRIEPTLRSLVGFLSASQWDWELLVADDGSSDATADLVASFAEGEPRVVVLRGASNQGKGAALRRAAAASTGEFVVYSDADLPVSADFLPELIEPLEHGVADLVLVSRWMVDAPAVRGVTAPRRLLSAIFRLLVMPLVPAGVTDSQCGFKGFRGDVARDLFSQLDTNGFAFDLELLCRARARSLRVQERPFPVQHVVGSTVRPLRDSLRMLVEVTRIIISRLLGSYRP